MEDDFDELRKSILDGAVTRVLDRLEAWTPGPGGQEIKETLLAYLPSVIRGEI